MLRNKFVILVVGLMFSVVVIYNISFFLRRKPGAEAPQKPVTVLGTEAQSRADSTPITSHIPLPRDRERWKRDPFHYTGQLTGEYVDSVQPDGKGKKKAAGIKLEGINVRNGKYFALVNGWVVEAGDKIDDVLITSVTRYSIFVKDARGIREISIYHDLPDKEK